MTRIFEIKIISSHNLDDQKIQDEIERLFKGYPSDVVKYNELLDVEIVTVVPMK